MDIPNQVSVTADTSLPETPANSIDSFFNLMLQTAAELDSPVIKSDKAEVNFSGGDKPQDVLDTQPSEDNAAIDNSLLFAQVAIPNNINSNLIQSNGSLEKRVNTQDGVQFKSVASPSSLSLLASGAGQIYQIQQNQPVHQAQQLDVVQEQMAFANQSDLINIPVNNVPPPVLIADSKLDSGAAVTKKIGEQKVKLDAGSVTDVMNKLDDSAGQNIEDVKALSEKSFSQPVHQQDIQVVPDKITDAFVQLGNLINGQTAPHLSRSPQELSNDLHVERVDYTLGMKNIQQATNETSIELGMPSITSFLKEGYDAKIKIYPPELGHVIAKLRVDKNSTDLVIMTENNHVKGIVEANLPRLRDHFQQAGINLADLQVQVSPFESRNQGSHQEGQRNSKPDLAGEYIKESGGEQTAALLEVKKSLNTIIDTYA